MRRAAATALALTALLAAGCGGDDSDDDASKAPEPSKTTEAVPDGECRRVSDPKPKPDGGEEKPTKRLQPAGRYEVNFETSCGSFLVRLDQKASPATAASFASLAEKGFFDGTIFHRIVPGFVIQGGDPTGSGMGGPGYSTRDKPPANASYTKGVVAMAKTAQEPPGTAGSQFYVVTGSDAGLPPDYAILGEVVSGMNVVEAIGELGDPAAGDAGTPLQTVVVEKATLRTRP